MRKTQIVQSDIEQIIQDFGANQLVEKLKDKTFMITGATGMIGSYFVYVLDELNAKYGANINILAVVRNRNKLDSKLADRIKVLEHDVTEPFAPEIKTDFILHAASPASPVIMKEHPLETNYANTLGTANCVNLALKNQAEIMFVSSREIYGEPDAGQEYFTEDGRLGQVNPLVPRNGYAEGKKAAENMLISAHDEYGLNVKVVRLAHTYGPGMSIHDGRVQADFLKNIVNHEDIVMKSDGSSIRTYTYIADAISAMFQILLNSKTEVYNISSDEETSIKNLAETLLELPDATEHNLKLVIENHDENQKGTAAFKSGILSAEKLKTELNWSARYDLKTGFERTLEHLAQEQSAVESSETTGGNA